MRFIAVVPVIAALLLVAGCASPAPVPEPSPTSTPTPTPTPTAAAEPSPTFPVPCNDLASDAEVTALIGYPVELAPQTWQLQSIYTVALAQGGLLTCEWTPPGQKPMRSADVSIIVSTEGPISDPEIGACYVGSCQVEAGSRWLRVQAFSSTDGTPPDPSAWDAFLESTKSIVSATSETESRWTPPRDAALFEGCPSGFEPAPRDFTTAADLAGLRTCAGDEKRYFSVLPGGAWAMPTLLADLPEEYHKSAWAPVDVAGTQGAIVRWGDGSFDVLASVDGSLVQLIRGIDVMEGGPQAPEITAGLVAELEAIIAAR